MKTTGTEGHTVTHKLEASDVIAMLTKAGLTPASLKFYSVEVKGAGISEGCTIIIRHEEAMNDAALDLLLHKPK